MAPPTSEEGSGNITAPNNHLLVQISQTMVNESSKVPRKRMKSPKGLATVMSILAKEEESNAGLVAALTQVYNSTAALPPAPASQAPSTSSVTAATPVPAQI